jgi:hypothetical protein
VPVERDAGQAVRRGRAGRQRGQPLGGRQHRLGRQEAVLLVVRQAEVEVDGARIADAFGEVLLDAATGDAAYHLVAQGPDDQGVVAERGARSPVRTLGAEAFGDDVVVGQFPDREARVGADQARSVREQLA